MNVSDCDLNNNGLAGGAKLKKMGVKGKKCKFAGDMDIFDNRQSANSGHNNKGYIWTSIRLPTKKTKGKQGLQKFVTKCA